jgi:hypothetical protein
MAQLDEIEAIKCLKYKYFRCLDRKEWESMAECFAEDAETAFDSGKYSFKGVDAIMGFLKEGLGSPKAISMHHGHHPEIEVTSETTARGSWYLEDIVIFLEANLTLHGAGFYSDEYVKIDGAWKIRKTGYQRTFEEFLSRDNVQSTRTMFDEAK